MGVILEAGGSVTNQSGGAISGRDGIDGIGGTVTVVNAGTISGSHYAVQFAAGYANGLVIDPNAVFSGQVSGGNAIGAAQVSTLELASAGSAGTLSGIGSQFIDFAQTTIDSGADWTLTGTNSFAAGTTVTNDGTLAIAAGGTLLNAGHITGADDGVLLVAGASVTNQSGGAISGLFGIFGVAAVTVVNAGRIAGSDGNGVQLVAGGSVTNQSGGSISGQDGIYGQGGAVTVVNAGTITGSSYAVKFAAGSAKRLIADPGAVFAGNVEGGGGVLELASAASAGTLSGFGAATNDITNFSTLQFDAGAAWTVSGNDSASGLGTIAITGFANGDTIDLTGIGLATAETFANGVLTLTSGSNTYTLDIEGTFSPGAFQISSDGNGGTDIVVCFAAGTHIGTPAGEVPVDKLKIGDLVLTAHNGPRAVTWIGNGKVLATRGRRSAATPVIVRKGALADNVPYADLRVTKAHSLHIDDVLIPVEFLVNHRTILWDDRAQEVEIYHVELDSHDVLIANGAPAESFRDDGNRWLFQNARSGWDLPPQEHYAPVLTGGPVVDAAWRRLLNRAGPRALPPLTEDPDLHLVIDGARVDPEYRRGPLYGFRLPSSPKSVVIVSREAVPAELGIARDSRSLGVALRQVVVRQGAKFMLLDADDERLTAGFHAHEPSDRLRWTDGCAELPAEAFARFDKGAEVMLHLGGATQYPDDQASPVRAAA